MSEHRYVPHPEDVRDADAELGRLCAHGRLKTIRCPECAGGAPAVPSEAAIEAVREQARYYAPFTPLTDDEVKRGAAALQRELGEWGCDRMHAQWARLVLGNAEHCIREAVGSLAPAPSGPTSEEFAKMLCETSMGTHVWDKEEDHAPRKLGVPPCDRCIALAARLAMRGVVWPVARLAVPGEGTKT